MQERTVKSIVDAGNLYVANWLAELKPGPCSFCTPNMWEMIRRQHRIDPELQRPVQSSSSGSGNPSVSFGSISVMYGTMIYIACYIVSLWTGDTDQINFRVKNWHLVEANTFYIFLVFAPVNLGESMFNELDEVERVKMVEQQDLMRSEISVLTERLVKLEEQ